MEAKYLILARYAEFTGDGLINVIGGDNDKIVANSYPYIHPNLLAASRIVLDRNDCSYEHSFKSIIVAGDTSEVIAEGASGTLPIFEMPEGANFIGTGMILQFRSVIFPKDGPYEMQLIVDQTVLAKARFRVSPLVRYQELAKDLGKMMENLSEGSTDA